MSEKLYRSTATLRSLHPLTLPGLGRGGSRLRERRRLTEAGALARPEPVTARGGWVLPSCHHRPPRWRNMGQA